MARDPRSRAAGFSSSPALPPRRRPCRARRGRSRIRHARSPWWCRFHPVAIPTSLARALQNELFKALGQPVVVLNKGGAAGTLGIIELGKAGPDGYTLALSPNN